MFETGLRNPTLGIEVQGYKARYARYNAEASALLETALVNGEGRLTRDGALVVDTGQFTGRSPKDKHIVVEPATKDDIWWDGNRGLRPEDFETLKADMLEVLADRDVEVQDLVCGAVAEHAVNIRLIAGFSWHALFLRHMLRRPPRDALSDYTPDFTIINLPHFRADPARHGTRSETVVAISFEQKLVLIAGTEYSGENKKAAFTILNHLYPARGILPMHCSANHSVQDAKDTALFFGLSGTGKTTLSSDRTRKLIGDDEHGWSDEGIFNFEGGCYAKTIRLSQESEPEIWDAVHAFGTVLENVVMDEDSRSLMLDDDTITENTRAAYPLERLANVAPDSRGAEPRNIFLLTCDAFGVTPPIARLSPAEARALFLLGFTSKVAGTERGVGSPEPTFSTCFGAPFLTRPPVVYADLFEKRLEQSGAQVWLVNTGWSGGDVETGQRMPISVTRSLLRAAMNSTLGAVRFERDRVWGVEIPCDGPAEARPYLDPYDTWRDKDAFDRAADGLRSRIMPKLSELGVTFPLSRVPQTADL